MKQRLYIDNSVFSGPFDAAFAEHIIPLFDKLKFGEFTMLFSTVTQDDLENVPEKVRDPVQSIKTNNF